MLALKICTVPSSCYPAPAAGRFGARESYYRLCVASTTSATMRRAIEAPRDTDQCSEATEHMAEGRSELLHPAQILHSPAHWVGRAGRVHIERPEKGVAQRDRILRAPPPARFSSAVNAERHAMQ